MRYSHGIAALIVTVVSALYVGRTIDRGWVPHDEGALAQSAERAMQGQLPHRDFDEIYTGGLTEVDGLAFRLLGVRLTVLRVVLFMAFVCWVPVLYSVAARFAGPVGATLATLVAVAWSVPNYSAALPSWYNLFFAVFALAAVLRYVDTGRRRWLVACGLAAGISVAIKIVGVYLLGGIALALVWHEQTVSSVPSGTGGRGYGATLSLALAALVVVLAALVRRTPSVAVFVHFVAPTAVLVAVLLIREWRTPHSPSSVRARRAFERVLPLAVGFAIPVAVLLAPYVACGAVHDVVRGVLITPMRRLVSAVMPMPVVRRAWPALVFVAIVAAVAFVPRRGRWAVAASLAATLVVAMWLQPDATYDTVWQAARVAVPLAVLCGAVLAFRERLGETLFAVLAVAALSSLVQYPFSAPIYFCYVAPLAVLAVLGLATDAGRRLVAATIGAFSLVFAVIWMNGQTLDALGHFPGPAPSVVPLGLARGGLLVPVDDAALYQRLIPIVESHAGGGGRYVYAAPDCPQVAFLADARNPTRALFDFLDDSARQTAVVLRALDAHDVRVVVVNDDPEFSGPIDSTLAAALRTRYPEADTVGQFTVRWRT